MFRLITLLALFILAACGQQGGGTSLKVTTAGLNNHLQGELYLIAHNPGDGTFMRQKIVQDPQEFQFTNGTWRFHVIFYMGDHNAEPRCGQETRTLDGTPVNLSVTVTMANCRTSPYASSAFLNAASDLQAVKLQSCASIPATLGSVCGSGNEGATLSYRIVIPNYTFSATTAPQIMSGGYLSQCMTGFNAAVGQDTAHFLLPGSAFLPFGFRIRSYAQASCTGSFLDFDFSRGLITPDSLEHAIWSNNGDQPTLYIKHSPSSTFALVANNIALPAESSFPIDLSKLLVNGTPPYTITHSGGGTISGTTFINDNTTGTRTFSISDANGNNLTLTASVILGSGNDFTGLSAPGWMSQQTSTNIITQSTTSLFEMATASLPRFWRFKSTQPPGLLIEPARMNKIAHHSQVSSWTNISSTAVTASPSSAELLASSQQSTLTDSATIAPNAVAQYQSPQISLTTGPGEHYVFSVYVKTTSAIISRISLSQGSPCAGVIFSGSSGQLMQDPLCPLGEGGIEPVGNGWHRVWIQLLNNTLSLPEISIFPAWSTSLSTTSVNAATGDLKIWGIQLELGRFPTSPILSPGSPTSRNAENIYRTTNLPLPDSGTILLRWSAGMDTSAPSTLLHANITPFSNNNMLQLTKTNTNHLEFTLRGATTKTLSLAGALKNDGTPNTMALSYSNTRASMVLNQSNNLTTVTTSATDLPAASFDRIYLGSYDGINNTSLMSVERYHKWDTQFIPEVLRQMVPP